MPVAGAYRRASDTPGLHGSIYAMEHGDSIGEIWTREMVLVGFTASVENQSAMSSWLFAA